jgi:hypothetical protein
LPDGLSGIFLRAGLDRANHVENPWQIEFSAQNRIVSTLSPAASGYSGIAISRNRSFEAWRRFVVFRHAPRCSYATVAPKLAAVAGTETLSATSIWNGDLNHG